MRRSNALVNNCNGYVLSVARLLVIESDLERFRVYFITALRCRGRVHRYGPFRLDGNEALVEHDNPIGLMAIPGIVVAIDHIIGFECPAKCPVEHLSLAGSFR